MVVELLDADIVFPLSLQELMAHVNRQELVHIAFRCSHGVEVECFDPLAIVSFDWNCFMRCVFRWALAFGIRPISMIGGRLPREGFDLEEHFRLWVLNLESDEQVTACS